MEAADGVPLQFGDAIAHADDAGPQCADAQEVGQAGHEALVHRRHELQDVTAPQPCAGEGFLLVVGQALQVLFRATEGHRVAQRARGGDVVHNILLRAATELFVVELQVLLFGERDLLEVLQAADALGPDAVGAEQAAVVGGARGKVVHVAAEQFLLVGFYFRLGLKFNVVHGFSADMGRLVAGLVQFPQDVVAAGERLSRGDGREGHAANAVKINVLSGEQ